jgi:hypothetical protein
MFQHKFQPTKNRVLRVLFDYRPNRKHGALVLAVEIIKFMMMVDLRVGQDSEPRLAYINLVQAELYFRGRLLKFSFQYQPRYRSEFLRNLAALQLRWQRCEAFGLLKREAPSLRERIKLRLLSFNAQTAPPQNLQNVATGVAMNRFREGDPIFQIVHNSLI